jgi:hypothetical protein
MIGGFIYVLKAIYEIFRGLYFFFKELITPDILELHLFW